MDMKKLMIIFFAIAFFSCDNNQESRFTGDCVRVKLINHLCGQAILQVLDKSYYDRGQDWSDGLGNEYEHVFSTLLPCGFNPPALGEQFLIRFTKKPEADNCARCFALLYSPEKFNAIELGNNCGPLAE